MSSTSPVSVHLYQIAYSEATRAALEPGYAMLDNLANPRPDWFEIWPMRQFLRQAPLDDAAFYGIFSPKFGRKTMLGHADVVRTVQHAAARGADVVLFSPQPDMSAFFLNVFEQGETFDPGLIDALEAFLASIGRPLALRSLVMDSRQTVFSNYFVARPAFWRAWLGLIEPFIAACEDPGSDVGRALTAPTTYPGQVQRKVFLAERLVSLLLATEPQWRTHAANPFAMAWSLSRLREYPHEAAISDALKMAHREHGYPEYLRAYNLLRNRFRAQATPLGREAAPSPAADSAPRDSARGDVWPETVEPPREVARRGAVTPARVPQAPPPVVVISFNNHPFVEHTLSQLRARGVPNIVVVDNASTWDETQRWLDRLQGCMLIRNPENHGHLCWLRPEIHDRLPDLFAVTDPDLLFNARLPADFIQVMATLALQLRARKVGFALDISDADLMFEDGDYHEGRSILDWERQFWRQPVRHESLQLFLAAIDTTFHIHNKHGHPNVQLRVAGDYTAKHLPWYRCDPVFGPQRMSEIYRHGTRISTMARLHLRHHGQGIASSVTRPTTQPA